MNHFETCMLYICFGGIAGTIIGYFIITAMNIVSIIKDKRSRRKEES